MEDKIYNIGVLLGNTITGYPKQLLHGIYAAAKGLPVNVLFFLGTQTSFFYQKTVAEENTGEYDYQYNTIYDCAKFAHMDALIISYGALGIYQKENRAEFLSRFEGIPYVVLEDEAENGKGTSIIAENYAGMRQVVEHLVKVHGYQKILFLSGKQDNRDANERKQAFLDVMRENDLPVLDSQIAYGDFNRYVEGQVETLLNDNPGAEALVCANDEMAFTAYQICEKRGLHVGKDIAITGFDDVEMAQFLNPPLTTVLQNGYEIGVNAFKTAMQLCQGIIPAPGRTETRLVTRSSCGCWSNSPSDTQARKTGINSDLKLEVENLTEFQRKSWFAPLLVRDLMENSDDPAIFYTSVMKHLKRMGMKSAYLYLFDAPIEHHSKDPWVCPAAMALASFFDEDYLQAFEPHNRPVIRSNQGFIQLNKPEGGGNFTAFTLFTGKWVYGLLFCEVDLDEIAYMYLISLHLGNTIRFLEVNLEEQSARRELQRKNDVLSFISEKDELTDLYNRRGLMEHFMALNQEHIGKAAYLIFVDMDHLKQINDFFGHSEGDFAIRTASGLIRQALKDEILGRIGGDEFIGVVLHKPGMDEEELRKRFTAACMSYNESSNKPYYLELSIGVRQFICSENTDFAEILQNADINMYSAKKFRRVSAIR